MASLTKTPQQTVVRMLKDKDIVPVSVSVRQFPDECIIVVNVKDADFSTSVELSSEMELELPENYMVVVRKVENGPDGNKGSVSGVADDRVGRLIELLNERSRTSEQQPSLEFVKDASENIKIAVTKRHHIVFGRRGVGKTALLLEAKRIVEHTRHMTIWQNMQTLRGLNPAAAFLTVLRRICELPQMVYADESRKPKSVTQGLDLAKRTISLLARPSNAGAEARALVPEAQRLVAQLCAETGSDLFIFLDDFHYLETKGQPLFLDMLHGVTRDTSAWLKISGIRNQCKLYQNDPPIGMQVGHDVAVIGLDITLEEPGKARKFLSGVLQTYLKPAGISNRTGVFSNGAIDRLVLASAGVPRDFLLLSARAIQLARERANARTVGTQDVNDAAGEAGAQKMAELEEDAASAKGRSSARTTALNMLRSFAIEEHHYSFFRIGFRDKNKHAEEYDLMQSLMDLRMIHIVKSSLSEAHIIGERSEVYMIDLSEYTGSRLRKNISVIELQGDTLVLNKTGPKGAKTIADTPRKVVQILRTGPEFNLSRLSKLVVQVGSGRH